MPYKRKYSGSSRYAKRAKRGYRRKRWTTRVASRKGIKRIARQVVLSAAESKDKLYNWGKTELDHNTPAQVAHLNGALTMPAEGTGDDQRNGDRIIMRGWKLRFMFGGKYDRPNITWRVIVAACQPGYSYTYSTFFRNFTGNALLDDVDRDRHTVLKQMYMKPQQATLASDTGIATVSHEYTFVRRMFVPRKLTYKFQTDGGLTHNDKDIICIVLAYDAYGTLITDNIGYVQVWQDMMYKDP